MAFDDIPPSSEANSPLITDILRRQNNILEHIAYGFSKPDAYRDLRNLEHGRSCKLCQLAQENLKGEENA